MTADPVAFWCLHYRARQIQLRCTFFFGIEISSVPSLVKVNDKGNLVMHDQLRDMGRQIVKEASGYECDKQSRIWDKEEARMVISNETVTSNIQAIWLPENLELPQQVVASKFHKMRKLRMLIMEGANETFIQSCFGQHFSQLKWLNI
ncbi:unnamed protein product, partial [Sphagnum balticum]